jgi:hypothetical protein
VTKAAIAQPVFRKRDKVSYRTIGRKGIAAPRIGVVLAVVFGLRGQWVEIKDNHSGATVKARPAFVQPI